jgi:lysine 6-dehydrogenase
MNSKDILILGAGLMGRVAAYFYLHHPQGYYSVRIADNDPHTLESAAQWLNSPKIETTRINVEDPASLTRALQGVRVCHSCVPYFLNPEIAIACLKAGVSFVDLGGNPEVTDQILKMDEAAKAKGISLIPDTGLAPGLASILAWELVHRFERCDEVHLRVGGLPQEPRGPLKYAQFFSMHGLLNEYLEDAREIHDGKAVGVASLEELESLEFDGVGELEAFITSGGTSTLTKTLIGKVQRLDYKTIRYPGHCEKLQFLRDIGMTSTKPLLFGGEEVRPRTMLASVLEQHLPQQEKDIVLVRVTASGDDGRSEGLQLVIKHDERQNISAMGQGTSFPSAAIVRAILSGDVPPGAHPQEKAVGYDYMKNELNAFGLSINEQ